MGSSHTRIFKKHQKTPETKSEQDPSSAHASTGGEQSNEKEELVYHRRDGAMSVTGQLYETKLLTLFLLRLLSNKVEFYLGANISGVGALDDLCFKYKPANSDKHIVVFLQAKHKVNPDKNKLMMSDVLRNDGDFSVQKHFDSYLKIRQRFTPKSKDVIFKSNYEETKCYFVVHTPVKHELKCTKPLDQNDTNDNVKDLIQTNTTGDIFQLDYDHFEFLKNQLVVKNIRQLGKRFIKYITKVNASKIMDDYLVKMYHVVLAQCVVELVEENETAAEGVRYKFQREFFDSKERLVTVFREAVYEELINTETFKTNDEDISTLISKFLNDNITAKSNYVIHYQNNDLFTNQFVLSEDNIIDGKKFDLQKCIQLNPYMIRNNKKIHAKKFLESLEFTLPVGFGNKDIYLKGNGEKIDKRLDFIATSLQKLFKTAKHSNDTNIVDVDEGMAGPGRLVARGMVELNGGLGSALGNLLVVDRDTGALKFNVCSPLPEHANTLWNKLKQKHDENLLTTYRFKFYVDGFPKTSFKDDLYEEYLVKNFIRQYWLCTGQTKEDKVECIAKKDIILLSQKGESPELKAKSGALFFLIHDKVQEWWMMPGTVRYLTAHTTSPGVTSIIEEPLLSVLNQVCVNNLKSFTIEFDKDAMKILNLGVEANGVILIKTNSVTLTGLKLMQNYKHSAQYSFIDFTYITSQTYSGLADDVKKSDVENFIVTCKATTEKDTKSICNSLAQFLHDVTNKNITVITDADLSVELKNKLRCAYYEVIDVENDLDNVSYYSKKEILNKCYVVCQGRNVVLKSIIGDNWRESHTITSHILERLINKDVIEIGEPLATESYNKIKPFYIERYLTRERSPVKHGTGQFQRDDYEYTDDGKTLVERVKLKSLTDLKQRIVVVTAPPGMGKSTFLTHLSIETLKKYPKIYIAHINLLDITWDFEVCKQSNIGMDNNIFGILFHRSIFINKIKSGNDTHMRTFQIDLFKDKCRNGEVIFIVYGFDETCSRYESEVIQFIRFMAIFTKERKNSREESKLWITSCSYNNLKHELKREFGLPYSLEPFSEEDGKLYLEKYWKHHMRLNEFTQEQISNVTAFMKYMSKFCDTVGTVGIKMDANGSIFSQNTHVQNLKHMNIPLYSIFVMAAEYLRHEINKMALYPVKEIFSELCNEKLISLTQKSLLQVARLQHTSFDVSMLGSPLYIHIAAEYLQSEIKHNLSNKDSNKWDLDTNTFSLYKSFLETRDRYYLDEFGDPINETEFGSLTLYRYQILGCYHLFGNEVERIVSTDELNRVKTLIEFTGKTKNISKSLLVVVNDLPVFVHRTFAEYFAADYICEALKSAYASQQLDRLETIWDFIVTTVLERDSVGVSGFLDYILFNDDELSHCSTHHCVNEEETKRIVFKCLMKQARNMKPGSRTALDCAVSGKLKATAMYLLRCIEGHLQCDDLKYLKNLAKNNDLLWIALRNGYEDFVELVTNIVRSFDKSIFCEDVMKGKRCIFSTFKTSPTNYTRIETSRTDCVKWSVSKTFAFTPTKHT